MAAKKTKNKPIPGTTVVATNRQARRDYEIVDTWECGIMLKGSEVKSLREARVTLNDAFARFDGRDLYLVGLHINAYSNASAQGGHEPARTRKLLAHRHELEEMHQKVSQEHLTLIPLSLYFSNGRVKVELGLARGKREYDKRQSIAKRDADRELERYAGRRAKGRV